jgi:hypothetical protein
MAPQVPSMALAVMDRYAVFGTKERVTRTIRSAASGKHDVPAGLKQLIRDNEGACVLAYQPAAWMRQTVSNGAGLMKELDIESLLEEFSAALNDEFVAEATDEEMAQLFVAVVNAGAEAGLSCFQAFVSSGAVTFGESQFRGKLDRTVYELYQNRFFGAKQQ